MREGPLWIVLPPLSIDERMSVNDPDVHDCEQRPWVTSAAAKASQIRRRRSGYSPAQDVSQLMRLDVDVLQNRVKEWMHLVAKHPSLQDHNAACIRAEHPRGIDFRLPAISP